MKPNQQFAGAPGLRLAGAKCALRPLHRDDAPMIVGWRNQPQVAPQMFSPPPTIDQHVRWFEKLDPLTRREFVIESAGGKPVGTIGLSGIDHLHRRAEYGILIGEPAAEGQGIALDASGALLDYGFDTLGLHRIFLNVFHDNIRALRLYERLGFLKEGVLRRHALRMDNFEDVIVMGLLHDDWRRSRQ